MKKILWISPSVPYDNVPHGGGKTQNFYIKKLQESGEFDIHLLTLARKDELEKIDLDEYGISYSYRLYEGGILRNTFRKFYNAGSALNPRHRLGHLIMSYEYQLLRSMIKEYAESLSESDSKAPSESTSASAGVDIVVLEWTGMLLLLPEIKKHFPDARVVCMEEDVFFQRLGRQYKAEKNLIKKRYYYDIYRTGKKIELSGLSKCDKIIVYSTKDRDLLMKSQIDAGKIYVTAPYYDNYRPDSNETDRNENSTDSRTFIMFYGAMFRPENIECAKRIIDGIMPALKNTDIELEIIGKTNDATLQKYESDRIHIRGYVDDPGYYLRNCLCFVAPLGKGAGIKIKTLEALSAGATVLTNEIGIEGIPAKSGVDYYYCVSVSDYINKIIGLYMGSIKPTGDNSMRFIDETYDLEKNTDSFIELLNDL